MRYIVNDVDQAIGFYRDALGFSVIMHPAPAFAALVATLRSEGAVFRGDIVPGVGGDQIIVEDPSGNPVELFQPTIDEARLDQPGE